MKMALLDFQCLTKQGKTPSEEDDEDCHHDSCDDGPVDDGVDSVPSCLLFIKDIGVGKAIAKQLENRAPGDEAEDKDVGEDEKEHVDRKAGTTFHPSQTAVDGEVEQAMHAFSQQGFHGGIFEARRREFLCHAREDGIHAAGETGEGILRRHRADIVGYEEALIAPLVSCDLNVETVVVSGPDVPDTVHGGHDSFELAFLPDYLYDYFGCRKYVHLVAG